MIDPILEEKAAMMALGWPGDPAGMERAAAQNPELAQTMREYEEVAAFLAYDAPQVEPPPAVRSQIMRQAGPSLAPVRPVAKETWSLRRIFHLPNLPVMPYALAACLMGVALFQAALILLLDNRLDTFRSTPVAHHDANQLSGVQLVDLQPQGDHGDAKIMVAWNGKTCCGMVSMADMPDAPAGSDYQLWVLDPSKATPVSAGVVPRGVHSQHFIAGEVKMSGRPGFAVSLEPAGGSAEPSSSILFAVAPSP